jgi:c(7)-type cytochrome triheme protein
MKKLMRVRTLFTMMAACLLSTSVHAADMPGKAIYDATCSACHNTGVAGAPKLGDVNAWAPRIKAGTQNLVTSAIKGKNAMPARGGNASLVDKDIQAAVSYMVAQASGTAAAKSAATTTVQEASKSQATQQTAVGAVVPPVANAQGVNTFNRLMRPPTQRNLPPTQDGIHDPSNDGTSALQPPLTAFDTLPKSAAGNRIDWVKALNENKINPRYDRNDPTVAPMVMDLNIVREVKGSMPDVVYPHKQHTQWLDCSNCHPAIFVPQKGANQISMAAILLGQKCGVCHGKVAFPVSECRRCHSKNKPLPAQVEAKQ